MSVRVTDQADQSLCTFASAEVHSLAPRLRVDTELHRRRHGHGHGARDQRHQHARAGHPVRSEGRLGQQRADHPWREVLQHHGDDASPPALPLTTWYLESSGAKSVLEKYLPSDSVAGQLHRGRVAEDQVRFKKHGVVRKGLKALKALESSKKKSTSSALFLNSRPALVVWWFRVT